MQKIAIIPNGVCCERILVSMEGGIIRDVRFDGGCDGNGKALARLLAGMPVERAAELLQGVHCDEKSTSCADQLAQGLLQQLTAGEKA